MQKVADAVDFRIELIQAGKGGIGAAVKGFCKPFDLSLGPPVRIALVETAPKEHYLVVDMHHIITDGTSMGVFIKDFIAAYEGKPLEDLPLQYKDYAVWQQSKAQKETIAQQKVFWLNEFSEIPETLEMPADFSRPAIKSYEGDVVRFEISKEETARLKQIAAGEGTSMFMLILSIYSILLSKLSNQEDVVIGVNSTGRHHPDLEHIMGMFVNTFPLRSFPKEALRFREFLDNVKERTLACFDNQDYQFEELIDELKIERDRSRNPLFEVMITYLNLENPDLTIPGMRLTICPAEDIRSKFDCSLVAIEVNEQVLLTFEYDISLFRKETIKRFISYFKKIVSKIVADTNILILDL
jgi:hypothetical protein